MDLEFKCVPFEIKATAPDGTFEGYANTYHTIDSYGEIVPPGAFADALPPFLLDGFIGGLNHNWDMPIGKPMMAEEQKAGLFVRGQISDTAHGRDVLTLMRDKVVKKLSIGYKTAGRQILETPEEVHAYWEQQGYTPNAQDMMRAQYGAVLLTKIKPLYEFSPVTVPANEAAVITAVKGLLWTPEEKTVSGSLTWPLAARDMAWDGSAAEKRIREKTGASDAPNAAYRKCFFWYDSGAANNFGSYKLGFCDVVDGEIKAVPRGIFTCAGSMMGARGGVDMPEADKPGVTRRIARYYARMRKEFGDDTIEMPGMGKALPQTEREFEEFLREAGFSRSQSVAATNHGFKALLREAVSESETDPNAPTPESEPEPVEEKGSETPPEAPPDPDPDPEAKPLAPEGDVSPEVLAKRQRVAAALYVRFTHNLTRSIL